MKRFFLKVIQHIENAPLTLGLFVAAFLGLIIVRLTIENAFHFFGEQSLFFFFFEFTHTFLFFLCSFLIILPVVRFAGAESLTKAANVLLFGFLIIWTPPIIDTLIFRGSAFWSFYEFDGLLGLLQRFFTLFGDTPDIGITYGVRVEVVLVTLALGCYAYLKSKRLGRALLVSLLTYTALFVLGTFPSWVTLPVLAFEKPLLAIGSSDVAALFLSPQQVLGRDLSDFRSVLNFKMSLVYALLAVFLGAFTLWKARPRYLIALAKNARLPQLVYHGGLLFLGILLALFFSEGHVTFELFPLLGLAILLIATWFAWLTSVIVNDCYDTRIDAITNPDRPLIVQAIPEEEYQTFGWIFFSVSLILAGIVSFPALLLFLGYQALAWLYSAPPFRLKQYPGVATLLAASAGMLVLSAGALSTSSQALENLPLSLVGYLFVAYFLALPIKDFKDIEGDRRDGVYTLPVLLGAYWGKQVIGSLLFLLFAASPSVLSLRTLFLPAILFGALSFFALQKGTDNEASFFAYRKLPRIILTLTFLYGCVIVAYLV